MDRLKSLKRLAKLIDYILARRPDEFGLVPDEHGFVKIKDLLKAIAEEDGFKYVRRGHLDEIQLILGQRSFEMTDNLIRSINPQYRSDHAQARDLPKLLYTCVRPKAHLHVNDKGISPTGHSHVILSDNQQLARRMGKRIDASPVLLTVQVAHCIDRGVIFQQAGQHLFLADLIPTDCFSGPPLPRDKPAPVRPERVKKQEHRPSPGSFFIDLEEKSAPGGPSAKPQRRDKKNKPRRQRPPWRR